MPDSLPPDLKALIRAKVESGAYASEEDVVRAAFLALDQEEKLDALRRDIQKGIDSGIAGPFDVEAMIERGRRRRDADRRSQQ